MEKDEISLNELLEMVDKPEKLKVVQPPSRIEYSKEILDAIKSLEKKFDAMQSREERDRQYKLMGYSIILAAILSTLIYITFRVVEIWIPQPMLAIILLFIGYFLLLGFSYSLGNLRKVYKVGDYVIKGDILTLNGDYKKLILKSLCEIAKINGNCAIKGVQMNGLTKIDYIYKTFREDYVKKLDYLIKNIDDVKSLDYLFGEFNYESFISLSFVENSFIINLSTKHFSLLQAKEILEKIKELEQKKLFANVISEGF